MNLIIENFKMSYGEHKNLECKVPCSMYSVLLEHNIIKDPFYGLNELELTSLSDNDCIFEADFLADDKMLEKEFVELKFFGLDTICEIYLNNAKIGKVKNMHREYLFDIKDKLKKGKNYLKLKFLSPIKYFNETNNKHWLFTNYDSISGAAHLRKAFYMSGWDWGPKLPDMGIFRKVCIDAYDTDKIESIFVLQNHEENKVTLDIEVETRHSSDSDVFVSVDGKEIKLDKSKKGKLKLTTPNFGGYEDMANNLFMIYVQQ